MEGDKGYHIGYRKKQTPRFPQLQSEHSVSKSVRSQDYATNHCLLLQEYANGKTSVNILGK